MAALFLTLLAAALPISGDVPNRWPAWAGGGAAQVKVEGSRAYVLSSSDWLGVLDFDHPGAPEFEGRVDIGFGPTRLEVQNGRAYVTTYYDGLVIADVRDPRAMQVLGTYSGASEIADLSVVGDHAYLAARNEGLIIVNVADPIHPVEVGQLRSDDISAVARVPGTSLLVVGEWVWPGPPRISVVDVSDPVRLRRRGQLPLPGRPTAFALRGNLAFAILDSSELAILDVTAADAPVLIGQCAVPEFGGRVTVDAALTRAWIADNRGGLQTVDITDLANPVCPGMNLFGAQLTDVAMYGSFLAAASWSGIFVLDVANPIEPTTVWSNRLSLFFQKLQVVDGRAFVADTESGLRIVDFSQPTEPRQLGEHHTPTRIDTLRATTNRVYLVEGGTELEVVDVQDPTRPMVLGRYSTASPINDLAIAGDHAYLAIGDQGVEIVDFRDPANPVSVRRIQTTGPAQVVRVQGGLAYVLENGVLRIYDAGATGPDRLVGEYRGLDAAHLDLAGDLLLLAQANGQAQILGVTNPASPQLLSSHRAQNVIEVRLEATAAYLMGSDQVTVLDLADPSNPRCSGQLFAASGTYGIDVDDRGIYLSEGILGLSLRSRPSGMAPPLIIWQPRDWSVYPGASIYLDIGTLVCDTPHRFQWRRNGANLPGATNQFLEIGFVTQTDAGAYNVVVSDDRSSVTSRVATVTLRIPPPYVYFESSSVRTNLVGQPLTLCVRVGGTPSPAIQWQLNGRLLSNVTGTCLTLSSPDLGDSGEYRVTVSNEIGIATAVLTLYVERRPPTIGLPSSQTASAGSDALLCASIGGAPRPLLRWFFNGTEIPGAQQECLWLPDVSLSHAGVYSVIASNIAGLATGVVSSVTVTQHPPRFDSQWGSYFTKEGADVRLRLRVSAAPPPTLYLRRNGEAVDAATVAVNEPAEFELVLPEASPANSGNYEIVASNRLGIAVHPLFSIGVTPADSLDRWTVRTPLPQPRTMRAIASGNGLLVAAGDDGAVLTSADGRAWQFHRRRVDVPLRGAAHGADRFVVVGDGGVILTSSDGTNWQTRCTGRADQLNSVAYGNGRFVAIGTTSAYEETVVLTSLDGEHWERRVERSDAGRFPQIYHFGAGIACGAGQFVAVGTRIMTSTDGKTWFQRANGVSLRSVSHGLGLFVGVGQSGRVMTSPDGIAWQHVQGPFADDLMAVAANTTGWVAAGKNGVVLTSSNAVDWRRTVVPVDDLLAVTFSADRWMMGGVGGALFASADGSIWTRSGAGPVSDLDGMTLTPYGVVFVGHRGTILTSRDGHGYFAQTSGTASDLHGIAWADGLAVAVGDSGTIVTSPDLIHWTLRSSAIDSALKRVRRNNGQWWAVGTGGLVASSPDGLNWSYLRIEGGLDLNSIASGLDRTVVVGDGVNGKNGVIYSFAGQPSGPYSAIYPGKNMRGVTFAAGLFVAVGNDGIILTSSDGTNWIYGRQGDLPDGGNLRDVAWARGRWMAVGNFGRIFSSTNGVHWSWQISRFPYNLHAVSYLNGSWLAAGDFGTVLRSDRVDPAILTVLPQGIGHGFEFSINAEPGTTHRLQATSNFEEWTDLLTFQSSQTDTTFVDRDSPLLMQRFYRVISP